MDRLGIKEVSRGIERVSRRYRDAKKGIFQESTNTKQLLEALKA